MADFYVKYGSNNAQLIGSFRFGKINIKLHKTKSNLYVISKNRRILSKCIDMEKAFKVFYNAIYLEDMSSNLF